VVLLPFWWFLRTRNKETDTVAEAVPCSTSVEELEVEEWVDSLPTAAVEARRHVGKVHAQAAVAGGRVGCGCLPT
jgi:hypothetical protein